MEVSMKVNFEKLQSRVIESLEKTDLKNIKNILSSLKEPTLVSGVGGSSVVSLFLSRVLNEKNNIISESINPRDIIYKNLKQFKNIIACSYSGNNFGVDIAFNNDLKKYLLSSKECEGVTNLNYFIDDKEESFISLSSTLIPMSIILCYYLDDEISIIKEILNSACEFSLNNSNIYEILSGYDTSVSSKFIESTFVESGIGIPIIHDKYDYCHGRTTLGYTNNSSIILLSTGSELDKLYKKNLKNFYSNVIIFNKKYDDNIINDYYFTFLAMFLCKTIAEKNNKDLSIVNYSPLVKKLYYFKGSM